MRKRIIIILCLLAVLTAVICCYSFRLLTPDIQEQRDDLEIGKNIIVTVSEELDAEALRNDDSSFVLLDEEEFLKLADYMQENDLLIKPGTYTFNQAWDFDDGAFILPNGERRKVLEFTEKSE